MNAFFPVALSFALGSSAFLAAQETRPEPAPDPVKAVVGRERITHQDVLAEMNRLIPLQYYHQGVPQDRMEELYQQALDSLVEKALIFQDAIAANLPASEDEIREEFDRTLQKAGARFVELPAAEKDRLLRQYRPLVVRRILLDKNEARFEATVPDVSEEQVRAAFEARKNELLAPPEAHLQHILIKVEPAAPPSEVEARKKLAEQLRSRLVGGEDFAKLAAEYSEDIYAGRGGDLGFVRKGSFLQGAIDQAVFRLLPGELSPVLDSIYGFHIVRCLEVKQPRPLAYEEVRDRLAKELQDQARAKARRAWLAGLRERIGVEIRDKSAEQAPATGSGSSGRDG